MNEIIVPEIKNDILYDHIINLAKDPTITTILEIGSSSGEGSTEAFVKGIKLNPNPVKLFCLEASKERFEKLKEFYKEESSVHCYNQSSVPLSCFPSEDDVIDFYNTTPTTLNNYPLDLVLSWLKQDINYIKENDVEDTGINYIKMKHNIQYFDIVLIDGSEFLGKAEFNFIYGAKYIILDDINAYKNYYNHELLWDDKTYECVCSNTQLRNGFSIFKRIK